MCTLKLPGIMEEKQKSLLTAALVDLDFFDSYFSRSEKTKSPVRLSRQHTQLHAPCPYMPTALSPCSSKQTRSATPQGCQTSPHHGWERWEQAGSLPQAPPLLQHSDRRHSVGAHSGGSERPPKRGGFPAAADGDEVDTPQQEQRPRVGHTPEKQTEVPKGASHLSPGQGGSPGSFAAPS